MNLYKPEIVELLQRVEQKYAKPLKTTTDFDAFSEFINQEMSERISVSTLKRLWGYVNDTHTPRRQTLDILSRYVGAANFTQFCNQLTSEGIQVSSFLCTRQILAADLAMGTLLEIGWSPNRYLLLQYTGNDHFRILQAQQSKLQAEDEFCVKAFQLGQPLYLPYIERKGQKLAPFVAGMQGGLTVLNELDHEQL